MVLKEGFDFTDLPEGEWVSKKPKSKRKYLNLAIGYDIGTTSLVLNGSKTGVCYSHCVAINEFVYHFRTWSDIEEFFNRLCIHYGCDEHHLLVVYVHNLKYEYQWIRTHFNFTSVFANGDNRTIMYGRTLAIEFRCSLMETQLSLAALSESTSYKKMVGDLEYTKIRHPYTKLTKKELRYIYNDVLVITEYINKRIKERGDISKIKYTKTGYARELFQEKFDALAKVEKDLITKLKLTDKQMQFMREVFHGGYTHGNPEYVGKLCKQVSSIDATSFYPTQMIRFKFPMSKGQDVIFNEQMWLKQVNNKDACVATYMTIKLCLKGRAPSISESKCETKNGCVVENGRVVSGIVTILVTDADFEVIKMMYEYEILSFGQGIIYKADYLPKWFMEVVLYLYQEKTRLKDVEGKEEEYQAVKGLFNSCYGILVQDPLRESYELLEDGSGLLKTAFQDELKALENINNDKHRFSFYPWGVWCTAYSQREIFKLINKCGKDWVYTDTDSVKIFNYHLYKEWLESESDVILKDIQVVLKERDIDPELAIAYNKNGVACPLGAWSYEGTYTKFKTLGAKRYCYTKKNKKGYSEFRLTCSGVNKKTAARYIRKVENFTDNMVIPKSHSGKKTLTYIDEPREIYLYDYQGNYYEGVETSAVFMDSVDYNLSLTENYVEYLAQYC